MTDNPDRLDQWSERIFRKWDLVWVPLVVLAILGTGIGFWIAESDRTGKVGIASATAAFLVAFVAIVQAWHARRAVTAADQATKNSTLPVMKSGELRLEDGTWHLELRNIGSGPALNITCWIDHSVLMDKGATRTATMNLGALGTDTYWRPPFTEKHELPDDWTVNIRYSDIYGRRFETRIEKIAGQVELHWGTERTTSAS